VSAAELDRRRARPGHSAQHLNQRKHPLQNRSKANEYNEQLKQIC
jgi:hypothetical protein